MSEPETTWSFLSGAEAPDLFKYRTQVISDIYRSMQSRLDGYRQAASAIFIGVIASVLAVDSAFFRIALDILKAPLKPQPHSDIAVTAGGALFILVAACAIGSLSLLKLHRIFAEMTSIVYHVDELNRVWDEGYWFSGSLFPKNFKAGNGHSRGDVSLNKDVDKNLVGWHDPAISVFLRGTVGVMLVHAVVYGYFIYYFS